MQKAVIEMFYRVGAETNQVNVLQMFRAIDSINMRARMCMYARDIREGMGKRDAFWTMFSDMPVRVQAGILAKLPELGYWKDVRKVAEGTSFDMSVRLQAVQMFNQALADGNGLAAKYTPRKGFLFEALRKAHGFDPKTMRTLLVSMTKVVEQKMCAQDWEGINLSHIPSKAMVMYRKALKRQIPEKFEDFAAKAAKGEAKVNAGALYPHQVVKVLDTSRDLAQGIWDSLPSYTLDGVMPIVDASDSMTWFSHENVNGRKIAATMGLYFAERATGPFKDLMLTFAQRPAWINTSKGNTLSGKLDMIERASWDGSTNVVAAFDMILRKAVETSAPQEALPKLLLIFSDMQFNQGMAYDLNSLETIKMRYAQHGYKVPNVVFWNLKEDCRTPLPASLSEQGVALVSGFSTHIAKAFMSNESFDPASIVANALMSDRYDI